MNQENYKTIYDCFSILTQELSKAPIPDKMITNIQIYVGQHNTLQHSKYIQLTESILIKINFDEPQDPITDIGFYYLDVINGQVQSKDDLVICEIIKNDQVSHYKNNNTFTFNLAKYLGEQEQENVVLLLCYKRSTSECPWSDLLLLPVQVNAPDGYRKLDQVIDNRVLWYSQTNDAYSISNKPIVSGYREWYKYYDLQPSTRDQFNKELALFCFPDGMHIKRRQEDIKQHTFIMTSEMGDRSYHAALIFCQELNQEEQKLVGIRKGYQEIGIILSSKYNYTEQSVNLLKIIYQYHLSKNKYPLERLICNIVDEIYLPQNDQTIMNYTENINYRSICCYPLCSNRAFQCLFSLLNRKNITILFLAMMLEKKIQLISSFNSFPSLIMQALLTLAFPFEYTHILISILPKELETYLEAPVQLQKNYFNTPYLVGLKERQSNDDKNIVKVYLDKDQIVHNNFDIPYNLYEEIMDGLYQFNQYYNPKLFLSQGDLAFPLPPDELEEPIDQFEVRRVFLQIMLKLMCHYQKYIDQEKGDIDVNEFLKHKSKYKQFMKQFVETRFFSYFIQQRLILSTNQMFLEYFDDCLIDRDGIHFKQFDAKEYQEYYQPNTDGIDNQIFQYKQFPSQFQSEYFIKPRFISNQIEQTICQQKQTPLQVMKFELLQIYKQWFNDLIYCKSIPVLKYTLHIIQEMKKADLQIDTEMFKSILRAFQKFKLDETALQLVQLLKKLGYHKLLHLYTIYFQPQDINQEMNLIDEQLPLKFYIETKCYKCGRLYTLEDLFSNFTIQQNNDQFVCTSGGTLGCNNVFVPLLIINDEKLYFARPSHCKYQLQKIFFYHLIGLPYYHYFKNSNLEEIVKQLNYESNRGKNLELVNIANMYTEYEYDEFIDYRNSIYLSVHQVFGNYLKHFKFQNIKPKMHQDSKQETNRSD